MKWTILLLLSLVTLVTGIIRPPIYINYNVTDPQDQAYLIKLTTATKTATGNSSLFNEAKKRLHLEEIIQLEKVVHAVSLYHPQSEQYRFDVKAKLNCGPCLMFIPYHLELQFKYKLGNGTSLYKATKIPLK